MQNKTTAKLTREYIENRQQIKDCLEMGIVNYSALADIITKAVSEDAGSIKKEAVKMALVRYKKILKRKSTYKALYYRKT